MTSVGIHIYPSKLTSQSRLERMAGTLLEADLFDEVHLVGMAGEGLPAQEQLKSKVVIRRLGRKTTGPGGTIVSRSVDILRWYLAVIRHYAGVDVTAVSAHSVWVMPAALILARRTGATPVYNPHELETEGATMHGIKQMVARALERSLLHRFRVVSVVNPSIASWYRTNYPRVRPLSVRNIPVDEPARPMLRRELGIPPEALMFMHTGNLVGGRNIPAILSAFSARPETHLVFLGAGVYESEIRAAMDIAPNIHLLPPVPPASVVSHLREGDVALVLIEPSCLSYQLSSPNKLFEALAAGTPPLCTDLPEMRTALGALAHRWIVPRVDSLPEILDGIDRADVRSFREQWRGLPPWEEEMAPLVEAYRDSMNGHRGASTC